MARCQSALGAILLLLLAPLADAQTPAETKTDEAVGQSLNYVFATDLGSGVYDLDGRTLQIYRFTYEKELREVDEDTLGVRFVLPLTFGFFDFTPLDVLSEGIPTRVDSFSLVPGFEFDYLMPNDWHLVPYARGGVSVASSSVDGWLYGMGVRLERERPTGMAGTASCAPSSIIQVWVTGKICRPIEFVRLRQGVDLTRGIGLETSAVASSSSACMESSTSSSIRRRRQWSTAREPFKQNSASRSVHGRRSRSGAGMRRDSEFGYRLAGELSAWHFLIGAPF